MVTSCFRQPNPACPHTWVCACTDCTAWSSMTEFGLESLLPLVLHHWLVLHPLASVELLLMYSGVTEESLHLGLCISSFLPSDWTEEACRKYTSAWKVITFLSMTNILCSLVMVQVTEHFNQFLWLEIQLRRKKRCTANGPCKCRDRLFKWREQTRQHQRRKIDLTPYIVHPV